MNKQQQSSSLPLWLNHLHIPYLPSIKWAKNYKKDDILSDLVAGLTVGVVLVPQGMAYALLARLPPVYGLYSSIIPPIVYALLGTSGQLMVGPVALVSLFVPVMAEAMHIGAKDNAGRIATAAQSSLLVGFILTVMGVLKLGRLLKFCSHSVMAAFTTAAGIFIGLTQLSNLFGFKVPKFEYQYQEIAYVAKNLGQSNKYSLIFGVSSLVFLLSIKYGAELISKKCPQIASTNAWKMTRKLLPFSTMLLVVVTTAVCHYMHKTLGIPVKDKLHPKGIRIVGVIPEGLSHAFHFYTLGSSEIVALLPTCFMVAILAYLESYSVAYKFAAQLNYVVDASQELIALGAANILTAFASGYPTTGSFSRSAIAADAGARTPFAGLVVSGLIVLVLTCMAKQLEYIPKAVLGAVIEVAVIKLFDWAEFLHAFRVDRAEFLVMLATAVVTVVATIEYGLATGVGASLVLLLYRVSEGVALGPKNEETPCSNMVMVMGKLANGQWVCIKNYADAEQLQGVQVLRVVVGPLLFSNAKDFKDHVLQVTEKNHHKGEFIILDCSGMSDIDMAGNAAIFSLDKELQKGHSSTLVLANVHDRVMMRLELELEQRRRHGNGTEELGLETGSLSVEDVYAKQVLGSLGNKASNLPSVTSQKGLSGDVTMLTANTSAMEEGRMGQ